jgi:hypothetical protein
MCYSLIQVPFKKMLGLAFGKVDFRFGSGLGF